MVSELTTPIYGISAEFDDPGDLLEAARAARLAGYKRMDAYTPFPIEGLHEELGAPKTKLPLIVLCGGIFGCFGGFFMEWFAYCIQYPMNIGGRPDNSWPLFIPVTFELTILFAALSAVFGMLALNGLPEPYHPMFNVERFALASRDKFFLCIEAVDPLFEREKTRAFLATMNTANISDVER
jgi:hypothetical protein